MKRLSKDFDYDGEWDIPEATASPGWRYYALIVLASMAVMWGGGVGFVTLLDWLFSL